MTSDVIIIRFPNPIFIDIWEELYLFFLHFASKRVRVFLWFRGEHDRFFQIEQHTKALIRVRYPSEYLIAAFSVPTHDFEDVFHKFQRGNIFTENARTSEQNNPHWATDDPIAILFIKSDLRLVVDLQTCVKAQQSRAYAQKVKISNLQQMARTVAYVQEHGYDSYEKLSETADTIYTKMAKARGDAKLTESKLRKTNEQIHYLGQYLSTKSIYGEFLKAPNKKIFRQAHSDELAQYEEALQILKQHSPDGKFPTMKDLRAEKEQLTIQKDAQYDTYHYFKDYHKELQTVCANVDSILGTEQEVQQHEQQRTRKYEPSL